MENNKYYGIGSDEYGFYKTIDNGKTWEYISEGSGDIVTAYDRIIIYSDSDAGLRYTDDNFKTIQDSNITDGNWIALPLPNELPEGVKNELYASSMDGRGIYKSSDNGEIWTRVCSGTGDKIIVDEGKIIIYGNGDTVIIEKEPVFYPESSYNPVLKETIPDPVEQPNPNLKLCLLYILNEIIVPQLCNLLTGYSNINNFDYNNELIYQDFFTDGEVYKTKDSGIDFVSDVGMQPFSISDLKDFQEVQQAGNDLLLATDSDDREILLSEALSDNKSKISKTFSFIDKYLDIVREYVQSGELKSIGHAKEDYTGLNTPEDRETMKMFYGVQKGAKASIVGTIINSIFTFNNSKKMALLKSSILIAANLLKDKINLNLNSIYKKIDSGRYSEYDILSNEYFQSLFNFDLVDTWKIALSESVSNYYATAANNINNITKNEDREYISVAADKYNDLRITLLDLTVQILNKIDVPISDSVSSINASIVSAVNNFYTNIDKAVIKAQKKEITEKELYAEFDNQLSIYKNIEDAVDTKKLKSGYETIADNIRIEFKNKIAEELNMQNSKLNDDFYFTKEDYEESFSNFNAEETEKVYKYYKIIIQEYKNRCNELLNISCKDIIEEDMKMISNYTDLKQWINILKGSWEFNYEGFKKEYSLNYITENINSSAPMFISSIKQSWKKMREII